MQCRIRLRQPGQVGGNLNEHTVIFHTAHNTHHGLPGGKAGGVLTPGSKQLPQGQHNAVLLIPVLDGAQQLLAHRYTVSRGSNPRN